MSALASFVTGRRTKWVVIAFWVVAVVALSPLGAKLADATSDTAPYLVGAALCAITLAATYRVTERMRPREA